MIKKLLLMTSIGFSMTACTTTELIHSPVSCVGQPKITLGFTQEESDAMASDTKKKLVVFVKTLRKRIDTQCEINKAHDAQYEE